MNTIIKEYRPFLVFLTKFFLSYLLFTLLYQYYLGHFDKNTNEVDGFSKIVAEQTVLVLNLFDEKSYQINHFGEPSIKIFYKHRYVSRIVEGCNAVSVMILFVSFVIAFTGKFTKTLLFLVFGVIIIHVLNVARIALLSIALFHYPAYEHLLHGVVFPLVIYGVVFLLWVLWVNKFSLYVSTNKKK